jgi:hypothetical protein
MTTSVGILLLYSIDQDPKRGKTQRPHAPNQDRCEARTKNWPKEPRTDQEERGVPERWSMREMDTSLPHIALLPSHTGAGGPTSTAKRIKNPSTRSKKRPWEEEERAVVTWEEFRWGGEGCADVVSPHIRLPLSRAIASRLASAARCRSVLFPHWWRRVFLPAC